MGKELKRSSGMREIEARLGSAGEVHFIRGGYEQKKLLKDSPAHHAAGEKSRVVWSWEHCM